MLPGLRSSCDTADLSPELEGSSSGSSIVGGGDVCAAEREEVVDLVVSREEPLCLTGGFEPLHLPLSSSGRLVRDLRPVVEVAALPVLDPGQDLPLGGSVALELVGHHTRGTYCKPLSSFLKKRLAALVLRRLWTRMSSTVPCWSTARHK